MLSSNFLEPYKSQQVPWGPVGYVTYKRTYARFIESLGRTEEWHETVARCVNGLCAIHPLSNEEAERLYDHVFNLRCIFSGRSLWQLGTNNIQRFGGDSLQSCWAVAINDPIEPFCFAFDELMLGGGVGFNVLPENIYELPPVMYSPTITRVSTNDCDYIVTDNREGWVGLLRKVLKAFFFTGKNLNYSTSCIRARGQRIKTFGGYASGSEELVKGIREICGVLSRRYKQKLTPVDCLDIMNIIGSVVVSGNVRRSAQIAVGPLDSNYINAKNWSTQTIPNWRAMSNNSVVCSDIEDVPMDFWEGYNGNGEAYGIINLDVAKRFGRIKDGKNYRPDSNVCCVNPCGEITLESYEACNLGEIFLPNISGLEQFIDVASLMYKVCKIISTLPFIHKQTNEVVKRNRRLGLSVTGFLQSQFRHDAETFNIVYSCLENLDIEFSRTLGVPQSIKLTTVKPSGTVSLLAGVTPGGHAAYAPYYIRRIRMAANDPLVTICKNAGYGVEPLINFDGTRDTNTMVVSFPIATPTETPCAYEMSAIDQLETQKWLQTHWADNSVSVTIYYHKEELTAIKQWLAQNLSSLKTVSFTLHSEHGFTQAPMEEITADEYIQLMSKITPITRISDLGNHELVDSLECASGACPIK